MISSSWTMTCSMRPTIGCAQPTILLVCRCWYWRDSKNVWFTILCYSYRNGRHTVQNCRFMLHRRWFQQKDHLPRGQFREELRYSSIAVVKSTAIFERTSVWFEFHGRRSHDGCQFVEGAFEQGQVSVPHHPLCRFHVRFHCVIFLFFRKGQHSNTACFIARECNICGQKAVLRTSQSSVAAAVPIASVDHRRDAALLGGWRGNRTPYRLFGSYECAADRGCLSCRAQREGQWGLNSISACDFFFEAQINYGCCVQSKSPAHHLLHGYLEWRWLHLTIVLKTQLLKNRTNEMLPNASLRDTDFERRLRTFMYDLMVLSAAKFNKVRQGHT